MAALLTVNTNMSSVLKRVEGMVSEIGEKRAALALARTIGNRKGRGVLSQVKKPASDLIKKTINIPKAQIKKQISQTLASRKPKSIGEVEGSSDFLRRANNAHKFKKKVILGGKNKTNRRKKKIGVSVKWWTNRPAQKIMGGFVRSNKGDRLLRKQVWMQKAGTRRYKSVHGPKASDAARARLKPLVREHQRLVDKILPKEMDAELRRVAGKWSGKGAKRSGV